MSHKSGSCVNEDPIQDAPSLLIRKRLHLSGIVQGVGMRPAIWRFAQQLGLSGLVGNDGYGVLILVCGLLHQVQAFIDGIPQILPPGARLDDCVVCDLDEQQFARHLLEVGGQKPDAEIGQSFHIDTLISHHTPLMPVAPDRATCPECLAEMNNPDDRRFGYPFTNCTHCGPRWSIVRQLPYERQHTSMADFPLCASCQSEYQDPNNRRFHAQAICCPECGPTLWLANHQGVIATSNVIQQVADLIQQGWIIAIKGLGGFQLACDARNPQAVQRLRQRKQRQAKPFALMAADVGTVESFALVSQTEREALLSPAAPIVLLTALGTRLPDEVACGRDQLGFMLPYTPVHSLLMAKLAGPIVLTSGNVSDEPPCLNNQQASTELVDIADYWLLHNRVIEQRLDDSVVREMAGQIRVLRRARGYCPTALNLPSGFERAHPILALGGELKNSFCAIQNGQALVSPYLGDLESAGVYTQYLSVLAHYQQYFTQAAQSVVIDQHGGYLSSQYATSLAKPLLKVQHHHAHMAACLAEHGVALDSPPSLGVIFDGLGMGDDGTLWGGEFLLADYRGYQRLAHFPLIALPGGSQAIKQPWRNTYAHLRHYFDWQQLKSDYAGLDLIQRLDEQSLALLNTMIDKQLNSPLCCSAGRWFDAFAAALGVCFERISYEGQAAILLEQHANKEFAVQKAYSQAYQITLSNGVREISWQSLWQSVMQDLYCKVSVNQIAARIHHSLIDGCLELLMALECYGITQSIVLTGGSMQNRLLLEGLEQQLRHQGKQMLIPHHYPANDGGLALGQAVIGAANHAN